MLGLFLNLTIIDKELLDEKDPVSAEESNFENRVKGFHHAAETKDGITKMVTNKNTTNVFLFFNHSELRPFLRNLKLNSINLNLINYYYNYRLIGNYINATRNNLIN